MDDILNAVKIRLSITGDFFDSTLTAYIEDIIEFLKDAGVKIDVIKSQRGLGVIARGVSDMWNYGSGVGAFSPMFYQRVEQLRHEE